MSKYIITLEIEASNDPSLWNWDYALNFEDSEELIDVKVEKVSDEPVSNIFNIEEEGEGEDDE